MQSCNASTKYTLDCLMPAVLADDMWVVELHAQKAYHGIGEYARTEIEIELRELPPITHHTLSLINATQVRQISSFFRL